MKLSSSTLCGCCFCCYCHCWLMMLLMVSSVVHVSPEMSTTTTTTKKYTKLNNNPYYLSEMTEFTQLNRKIPNSTSRTSRTVTTTLPSTPAMTYIASNDKNTDNKGTKVNIYPPISEHELLTTIQTQSTMTSTTTATTPAVTKLSSVLPQQQLQISTQHQQRQKHLYDTTTSTDTLGKYKGSIAEIDEGVLYVYDNRIPGAAPSTTTDVVDDNYVAANNVFRQEQEQQQQQQQLQRHQALLRTESTKPLVIARQQIANAEATTTTTTTKTIQITKQDDYSKNRIMNTRQHNTNSKENTNTSMESNANTRQQQLQQHHTSRSESSKVFVKNPIESQKTTTGSINNNNNSNNNIVYGTMNNNTNNHLLNMKIQKPATTTPTQVPSTSTTNSNSNGTTILSLNSRTRTSRSSSSDSDSSITSVKTLNITNNQHNDNNNMNNYGSINLKSHTTTSRPIKEISQSTDSPYKHQMPALTTSLEMRTTATYPTYSPMLPHNNNQVKQLPALLHRNARQITEDVQNEKCRMFIEGDPEKNELYSPDYPNDYPKNINCTRIITAPKGQIIRLDFRNSFHIEEKEECKFDFLEIRDGQYGFSNLIGKYCGTDFPPEITSKERYLWLHFHSDESIEYSGFTAVYEFIDRNRDAPSTDLNCTIEKDGFEGFINASDVPTEIKDTVKRNKIPLDCMWRIQVQDKWKIQVKFLEFKLAKPNDCETNFLDIFPEQTVMPLRVKNFCGSAGEGITSESNILHMRFYAEQIAINSSFSILYTAFRDRGSSSCTEEEYDCEDATCISSDLKCNDRDNCKFRWDEEGCKPEDEGQSEHMIIIITVFGLILGGMVLTFLVNCVRKIMHDQKIIREHIRQSKESKLDEMGRNSKARSRDNLSIVSPRQKHSQTSLQILDDVSNRYYREMELQSKGNFKEKDPSILRHHDMIVQTSLCSTDDSSTTITEQQTPAGGVGSGACDMGCQTRESLFATASLMRQKSKTPSMAGSQRTMEGVPPPPRFSTFGYDAAQIAPPPPPAVSTLSRRNMHLPQEEMEMEQLPQQTTHVMMPHQQLQHQQQHQHLHHRPSQEICHHHHQHQQHLQQQQLQQQQKQTLPRHQHQQQQQQQHHQHIQQQQQQHHHHTAATTIPPNVSQLPPTPGTSVVTAISTGSSGRPGVGGGKNKQSKLDESKVFIDIRNSAPDVIIMTSH